MEDRFHYEAAKLENDARQKRLANRKTLEEQRLVGNEELPSNSLLVGSTPRNQLSNGEDPANSDGFGTISSTSRRKMSNKITDSEKRRSMQIGFDVVLAQVAKKGKSRKRRHDCHHSSNRRDPRKRNKKNDKENGITLQSLFGSSLFEDAHTNSLLPEIPGFTSKNKTKALFELTASIPTKDQKAAVSDKQQVLKATRKFTKSATSDGKGGWKIRGLKTRLYHHQVRKFPYSLVQRTDNYAAFGRRLYGKQPLSRERARLTMIA